MNKQAKQICFQELLNNNLINSQKQLMELNLNLKLYSFRIAIKELEHNYGIHLELNSFSVLRQSIIDSQQGPFLFMILLIFNHLIIYKNGQEKLENILMNIFKLLQLEIKKIQLMKKIQKVNKIQNFLGLLKVKE